jgi:hypothetical protein
MGGDYAEPTLHLNGAQAAILGTAGLSYFFLTLTGTMPEVQRRRMVKWVQEWHQDGVSRQQTIKHSRCRHKSTH